MQTWPVEEGDVVEVIGTLASQGLKLKGTLKSVTENMVVVDTEEQSNVLIPIKDIAILKKWCPSSRKKTE